VHRFHARDLPTALVRSGQVDPLDLMDEGIPVRHRERVTVDLVAENDVAPAGLVGQFARGSFRVILAGLHAAAGR